MALAVLLESWGQAGSPPGSWALITHHERRVKMGFCPLFSLLC